MACWLSFNSQKSSFRILSCKQIIIVDFQFYRWVVSFYRENCKIFCVHICVYLFTFTMFATYRYVANALNVDVNYMFMVYGNVCLEVFYKRYWSLVKSVGKLYSDPQTVRLGLLRFYSQNKYMLRLLSKPLLASISYPLQASLPENDFFYVHSNLTLKYGTFQHSFTKKYDQWKCTLSVPFFFPAIDGHWSAWSSWSPCGPDCRHHRTRTCTSPSPSNGGRYCSGRDSVTGNCSGGSCIGMKHF